MIGASPTLVTSIPESSFDGRLSGPTPASPPPNSNWRVPTVSSRCFIIPPCLTIEGSISGFRPDIRTPPAAPRRSVSRLPPNTISKAARPAAVSTAIAATSLTQGRKLSITIPSSSPSTAPSSPCLSFSSISGLVRSLTKVAAASFSR